MWLSLIHSTGIDLLIGPPEGKGLALIPAGGSIRRSIPVECIQPLPHSFIVLAVWYRLVDGMNHITCTGESWQTF